MLLAAFFAAIGVGTSVMLVEAFTAWGTALLWEKVPADIQQADLHAQRSNDSQSTPAYTLKVRYAYQWEGESYIGTKLTPYESGGASSAFYQRVHEKLEEYRTRNETFRCYVNPQDPTQSVLYRVLTIRAVGANFFFTVVFGCLSFSFITRAYNRRRTHKKEMLRQQYPDSPWCWKKEWCAGVIPLQKNRKWIKTLIVAILWSLGSIPMLSLILRELQRGDTLILVLLIFPGISVAFAIFFMYRFLQWWRFGRTVFQMASVPGVLGGRLNGNIHIPSTLLPQKGIRISLNCVHRIFPRRGSKHRKTIEPILWQQEEVLFQGAFFHEDRATFIPVDFYIPYDQPWSNDYQQDEQIIWQLRVKALSGMPFSATFHLPVFKTQESDPAITTELLKQGRMSTVVDEPGHENPSCEPVDATHTGDPLRRAGAGD